MTEKVGHLLKTRMAIRTGISSKFNSFFTSLCHLSITYHCAWKSIDRFLVRSGLFTIIPFRATHHVILGLQDSSALRKQSVPVKLFLSQQSIKLRSNYFRTHLASYAQNKRRYSTDAQRHRSKLRRLVAETPRCWAWAPGRSWQGLPGLPPHHDLVYLRALVGLILLSERLWSDS